MKRPFKISPAFFFLFCLFLSRHSITDYLIECSELPEKKYLALREGAETGKGPHITIAPAIYNAEKKSGCIHVKAELFGLWKAQIKKDGRLFDVIEIPDGATATRVGEPSIPLISLDITVPSSAKLEPPKEKATLIKTLENILMVPCQEPPPIKELVLQKEAIPKEPPFTISLETYNILGPYPGRFSQIITDSFLGERRVLILHLFPVQYYPRDKILKIFLLDITIPFKQ